MKRKALRLTPLSAILVLGIGLSGCRPMDRAIAPEEAALRAPKSLAKVSSHLLQARRLARQGKDVEEIQEADPLLRFRDDLPEIEVRLESLTPDIVDRMREIGMRVESFFYQYARVYGLCDLELLDEIAAIPEVSTIHPNYGARTRVPRSAGQQDPV